jgi:hypothetical protein
MVLSPPSRVRDVRGLTARQKRRIRDFFQGAVYCWCKNHPNEWFSLRDLMGGVNYHWDGTPLLPLYQKYYPAYPDADAVKKAGHDGGCLLKRVLRDDRRMFETRKAAMIRQYRWVRNPTAGAQDGEQVAAADRPYEGRFVVL